VSYRQRWFSAAALLLVVMLTSAAFTSFLVSKTAPEVTSIAKKWVNTLEPAQRDVALYPYDSPKRVGWHFIPLDERKGLELNKMTDAQRDQVHKLLQAALSKSGYSKTSGIMRLETLLKAVQTRGPVRDPLRYYVTIFGDPASDSRWGLSYEGHHLSLNFVFDGEEVVSSTPQFFATNPAEVKQEAVSGFPVGLRILRQEEELAFELINDLSKVQQLEAVIAKKCPREIRAAGDPQPPQEDAVGIAWGDLNEKQQQSLKELIGVYVRAMPADVAETRYAAIEKAGWDNVHFAWAGAFKAGAPHYYRVQGPSFLIELVNSQPDVSGNPANHVHCVWRDMRGDFALPIESK